MGLATIDPHSQKENAEIPKIPKSGVNRARKKFTKKYMEMRTKSGFVRISIHSFVIFSGF